MMMVLLDMLGVMVMVVMLGVIAMVVELWQTCSYLSGALLNCGRHIYLSGALLNCCRYVHIGPKLCSLLVRLEETDEVDGVNSESWQCVCLQDLWHHLALPPDITLMLCSNGIQQQRIQAFPANILFVQYGFQVCVCVCRLGSALHN